MVWVAAAREELETVGSGVAEGCLSFRMQLFRVKGSTNHEDVNVHHISPANIKAIKDLRGLALIQRNLEVMVTRGQNHHVRYSPCFSSIRTSSANESSAVSSTSEHVMARLARIPWPARSFRFARDW